MMKIGIDARFWNETGVGRYIRNLVGELSEIDKTNSYVLFMKSDDTKLFKPKNNRWSVISTDIHWHSLSEQLHFSQILNQQNLDLMHFPYFSIPIRYSRPYIVTIHDLILHHFATGEATTLPFQIYKLKLAGYKYIMNRAARNAKRIITVSHATSKEIIDHLHVNPSKVSVIYEGVDPAIKNRKPYHKGTSYSPTGGLSPSEGRIAAKTENRKHGKYFLHVGNVYPHKNAKRLIEAFSQVNSDGYSLLFVGKKDYFMQKLEKFVIKSNLEKKVLTPNQFPNLNRLDQSFLILQKKWLFMNKNLRSYNKNWAT